MILEIKCCQGDLISSSSDHKLAAFMESCSNEQSEISLKHISVPQNFATISEKNLHAEEDSGLKRHRDSADVAPGYVSFKSMNNTSCTGTKLHIMDLNTVKEYI